MQGSGLNSSSSGSNAKPSRRHKPLKPLRSRGGGTAAGAKQPEQQQAVEKRPPAGTTVEVDCTVKVRDDSDGHLIYHKGDFVDKRCEFIKMAGR
jgi:hypothetical protein